MKEFNLERALAGEPVITRDGRKVTQLTLLQVNNRYSLIGVVDGLLETFTDEGVYDYERDFTDTDLFMVEQKKSVWVNVYEYENGQLWVGDYYNSLEEANKHRTQMGRYIKTIEITNEP
jgi:hypothetical protein